LSRRECEHRLLDSNDFKGMVAKDEINNRLPLQIQVTKTQSSIMQRTSFLSRARKIASEIIDSKFYWQIWRSFDATFVTRRMSDP